MDVKLPPAGPPTGLRLSAKRSPLFLILTLALLSALFVSSSAIAATPSTDAKTGIMTYSSEGGQTVMEKTLPNGLQVIVIPSQTVPIVTIEIAVKNGAYTETPKLSGLSHLFEHMFFKSNAVIPNQEAYMERIRQLGISFNGTTGNERVNYFFTLPTANLVPGLKFMYDAITSVKFDEAEFNREKEVVVGEIDRNEANPYYWYNIAMTNALFYKYPNRKNALGTRESVRAATTKMMQTMKDTYYVPNNSALLISGDIDPTTAFAEAEKQFASWKKGKDPFKRNKVPKHPPLKKDDYVVVNQPVNVPVFSMLWQGPSVNEDPKATYAADVLGSILSQPESPFQKHLVDSQAAYSASLSYYTQAHVGPITAQLAVAPEKINEAVGILLSEIEKMKDPSYFSETEIKNAQTLLTVARKYEQENPSSYIHTVSYWWAISSLDYSETYIANIDKVTAQDLVDFVKKYIDKKHFVAGLLISDQQAKAAGITKATLETTVQTAIKNAQNPPTPPAAPADAPAQATAPPAAPASAATPTPAPKETQTKAPEGGK